MAHGGTMEPSRKRKALSLGHADGHILNGRRDRSLSTSSSPQDEPANIRANNKSRSSMPPRPVKSCTECRQQKIRCDAIENYPDPCSRCAKMARTCVVDPSYRPKKGGQFQLLKDDITTLKEQVDYLQKRENTLASFIAKNKTPETMLISSLLSGKTDLTAVESDADTQRKFDTGSPNAKSPSVPVAVAPASYTAPEVEITQDYKPIRPTVNPPEATGRDIEEFMVGSVKISRERAESLHAKFLSDYLHFLPIIQSNSATELYKQSRLLFWTVCLTASLSEPEPSLYNSLCDLIKQLAIETCWMQTPRSAHVVQALLILGNWPLPNVKVIDDCSYRFIGLAKNLGMQLGLHRGKFIYEFSRTQTSLPDAEKWRTRTWLSIYFSEQVWSANLGLPPNIPLDYLVETARSDESLPKSFRSLLALSVFHSRLVEQIGSSPSTADGLIEPSSRYGVLTIMMEELERLGRSIGIHDSDPKVELYFLYVKLMICVFSFLPGYPLDEQAKFVMTAFNSATRVITVFSQLATKRRIVEYPIYMRHPVSFAAFILFRLHLSPLLLPQQVESARQSVVTVHRLFRNMLTAWKDLENDISRTAKVLEKLNFVIITHPYLLTQAPGIITRMRSHLTASMFYELIWAIHEARRRGSPIHKDDATNNNDENMPKALIGPNPPTYESVPPLPFYNQITRDDFTTNAITTPNGTTITTLVPRHANAANNAFLGSIASPLSQVEVSNGAMLENGLASEDGAIQQALPTDPSTASINSMGVPDTPSSLMASDAKSGSTARFLGSTGASSDPLHLDTLMQGIDWMNGNGDDFLGWMDMNVTPI